MISKSEVKYIQSLTHKKNRDREGVFVAEGVKLLQELLWNDADIVKIYATKEWMEKERIAAKVVLVTEAELNRLSNLETPNKVVVVVKKKSLPSLIFENRWTLALDGIQDPGNLGTIIRIADWFGIEQIVATPDTADCYNSKVVQSSMGSLLRVHIWYDDSVLWLKTASVTVFGALLNGKNMFELNAGREGVLVIGNESKGIRENVLPFIQQAVTIPRTGKAESLNAAVATGILLSHLLKK